MYKRQIWNWGVFYEKLLQSVLAGSYKAEGQEQVKALNYWWGMSAGVIDLICSCLLYTSKLCKGLRTGSICDIYQGNFTS